MTLLASPANDDVDDGGSWILRFWYQVQYSSVEHTCSFKVPWKDIYSGRDSTYIYSTYVGKFRQHVYSLIDKIEAWNFLSSAVSALLKCTRQMRENIIEHV
jgi:hypothetical protein